MAVSGSQLTKVAGYMAGAGKAQAFTAKADAAGAPAWYKIVLEGHDASILALTATGAIITAIPSGATQGGAGAAANELWKTASHASLPDNVVLIGV